MTHDHLNYLMAKNGKAFAESTDALCEYACISHSILWEFIIEIMSLLFKII